MVRVPITEQGFKNLEEELKRLKNEERPKIIKAISEAREHGDLSENAEYHSAKEKQSFLEGRIRELEGIVATAEIVHMQKLVGSTDIKFGAKVKILDVNNDKNLSYRIVGEVESDLSKGFISLSSPVGRALIGKKVGDYVEVNTPSGIKEYEILEILYED